MLLYVIGGTKLRVFACKHAQQHDADQMAGAVTHLLHTHHAAQHERPVDASRIISEPWPIICKEVLRVRHRQQQHHHVDVKCVCDYHRPSWNGSTKTAMHSKFCPEQEV
jgi:hypothetical protein